MRWTCSSTSSSSRTTEVIRAILIQSEVIRAITAEDSPCVARGGDGTGPAELERSAAAAAAEAAAAEEANAEEIAGLQVTAWPTLALQLQSPWLIPTAVVS